MILTGILFVLGILALIKGANWLVDGASSIAGKFGVPPLIIGLTIVAFGTSMPELFVNVLSAISGATDVAFGNVVGSNIANLLLVLGITAVIAPIAIKKSTTWKEIPFSLLAVLVLFVFASKPVLDSLGSLTLLRSEGIILLIFFAIFLYYAFELARKRDSEQMRVPVMRMKLSRAIVLMIGGLVGLFFGGKFVVDGAVEIARLVGLSEYVIAATIVAIGTSLPELVTSIVAARKGNADLAVGNIIGSNIFNIFWILGITAIISPIPIPALARIDLLILLAATITLFLGIFLNKNERIERWQGVVFVAGYVAYITYLLTLGR